jgi:hypothetical protein
MPTGVYKRTPGHIASARKNMKLAIEANRGRPISEEHRKNLSDSHKGIKYPLSMRKKSAKRMTGVNNPNWKGGISPLQAKVRDCLDYKLWREAVFKRDNYICVLCIKGGALNADHIIPFSLLLREYSMGVIAWEDLFLIDNGRTLCVDCHKRTKTFKGGYKEAPEWKLYDTLFMIWQESHEQMDFDEWYEKTMNKIIQNIEAVLN